MKKDSNEMRRNENMATLQGWHEQTATSLHLEACQITEFNSWALREYVIKLKDVSPSPITTYYMTLIDVSFYGV